jgi:hypothetical protein
MKEFPAKKKRTNGSLRLIWATYALVLLAMFFSFKIWDKEAVIDWDISQYYSYLPATFIYEDYSFNDRDSLWHKAHFRFATSETGDTLPVKMTSGLAIMYAPLFLPAHAYAVSSDRYEANGFSTPYRFAILLSACLASIVAFWLLGKVLMIFFSELIAGLTTVIIFTGTNIPYYSLVEPMTHVYSLALVCGFVLLFYRYLSKPKWSIAAFIGLVTGLFLLIRPSNLVILAFPAILLFAYRGRLALNLLPWHLGLVIMICFLVWVPQCFYWWGLTGNLLYYSYGEEGFFLGQPEILNGLFSYRKGWFVYSPVLILALVGIPLFYRQYRAETIALVTTLLLAFYLVFSWWCWWYGGSFGARALIEYLPFMAMLLAALLRVIGSSKRIIKISLGAIILTLCTWSLFMNWQYYEGLIHYDAMTKEVFWKQFLQTDFQEGYWKGLDHPDYDAARQSR